MPPRPADPVWADQVEWLHTHPAPDARRNATLLAGAQSSWANSAVPHTSMTVLLFTCPHDQYPFERCLYVNGAPAICEFGLTGTHESPIVVERCLVADAPKLLDRFLQRLTTGEIVDCRGANDAAIWSAQLEWLTEHGDPGDAVAMANMIRSVRDDWQSSAVPLPMTRSLTFVKAADPPTAVRPSISLEPGPDRWTLTFFPYPRGDEIDRRKVRLKHAPDLLHKFMTRLTA